MAKKGSLELSVNSIVILIIAIAVLGLIIGFVRSKFVDLNKQILAEIPDPSNPSSGDEITVSPGRIVEQGGKPVGFKMKVYNKESEAVDVKPGVTCTDIEIPFTANSQSIPPNGFQQYELVAKLPHAAPGIYLCQITAGEFTKDLSVQVI
ncbi:hypothetical protein C4573_05215 [Candidatus Woesearchaeota archaeon]|nr:MAG: hypothetical protein C4573_05215 [Candidatus Woesearchaeota archaeon]